MPLTLAATFAARPRLSPPLHLWVGGGGDRLAVALDDQHVAVVLGQGTVAEVDISRTGQTQDPLLDRRARRGGPQEHPPEFAGDLEADPGGQPAEPVDDQRAEAVARQAQRHVQRVYAGPAAVPGHEEGPDLGDRPTTRRERSLGGGVRHAGATGLPGGRVEPIVAGAEEEWDEHASQRPQEPQQGRLEREERRGLVLVQAVSDDLVEPLVGLPPHLVDGRWTGRGGGITLRIAHGDRLRTVSVWDLFSGQDTSPERPLSAPHRESWTFGRISGPGPLPGTGAFPHGLKGLRPRESCSQTGCTQLRT